MLTGFASRCDRIVAPILKVVMWAPSALIITGEQLAQITLSSLGMLPEKAPSPPASYQHEVEMQPNRCGQTLPQWHAARSCYWKDLLSVALLGQQNIKVRGDKACWRHGA